MKHLIEANSPEEGALHLQRVISGDDRRVNCPHCQQPLLLLRCGDFTEERTDPWDVPELWLVAPPYIWAMPDGAPVVLNQCYCCNATLDGETLSAGPPRREESTYVLWRGDPARWPCVVIRDL